jgi:hypothetical protein
MSGGMHGWWEPLAALAAIVLPLLLAWWLVARGVRRPGHRKGRTGDNAKDRRDPS